MCFARAVQHVVKQVMRSETIFAQNVENKGCKNPRRIYPLINPIGRGPAEAVNGDEYQRKHIIKMVNTGFFVWDIWGNEWAWPIFLNDASWDSQ